MKEIRYRSPGNQGGNPKSFALDREKRPKKEEDRCIK